MTEEKVNHGPIRTKKTKTEKLISVATSVLLAVAVMFCAFVIYQIQHDGYVTVFGCSVFHVVSGSMEPEIAQGALIISQKTDIEDIEVGDIISFRSLDAYMSGGIVTHRVVAIHQKDGDRCFVTRGDANNSIDSFYVTRDNFVGKIIYHTTDGNFMTSLYGFLTDKNGFFIVVIVPVILLTVVILQDNMRRIQKEIKNIKKEIEKEQREAEAAEKASTPDREE